MGAELTDRQKDILLTIVRYYIKTQKPVSSEDVLSNFNIKASSATIRNDMQKLQKLKYIYQQHTSAGRIPSDSALKLYFDVIKDIYSQIDINEMALPKNYKFYDLNLMYENFARMLAMNLNGLVVFEYPNPKYVYITRTVVTPVTEYTNVITLMTNLGMTISRTLDIYDLPNPKELEKILNEGLVGKSLAEIFLALQAQKLSSDDTRITGMLRVIEGLLDEFQRKMYITAGFEKVISNCKPSMESVEALATFIENDAIKDEIFKLLVNTRDLQLTMGNEFDMKPFKNFAFFHTSYYKASEPIGRILLITGKYSDYEKIHRIMNEYTSTFSQILSKNL